MQAWKLYALSVSVLIIVMIGGCAPPPEKPGAQAPAASKADQYKQAMEKPVSVNAAQSPDGSQLTVQYAAVEICKAAGVPYQFEKSQQLAGNDARRFVPPLQVSETPASQALSNLLAQTGLRYEVDDNGLYLCR